MPEIHVTDEQGTEHIFPDGSTPEMIAQVLKVKPPSTDLSANPKGEGVYQMKDAKGASIGVPYSRVQEAAQTGHSFADDANKFRYAKDYNYATTGPGHEDAFAQSDQNAPLGMQFTSGVAKGIGTLAKPVMDVVGAIGKVPQGSIDSGLSAQTPVEGAGKFGTMAAAAAPGVIAAPIAAAGGLIGGTAGATVGQVAGDMANLSPTQKALLTDALGVAGGAAGAAGAQKIVPKVGAYLRPTPSPSVVPRTEMASRNLASVILPENKDAANYIQAAQQEVPNILEYAQRTGNPLKTQLEFSKAAKGYAEEVLDLKQKIEGPIQNKLVRTTGTGYGDRMNEGPDTYATVKEIDKRIVTLNNQLDAPKMNTGDQRNALAGTEDLQKQVEGLRTILHKALADASGLQPEQIADIRQRAGRAYELANDTDAAVMKRSQEAGRADLRPIKPTELPSKALNFIRGNQVNVADRAFQRAIADFPGQPRALPTPTAPPSAPAGNTLDSLLQSSRNKRVDELLSLKNLLRIQNMQ